MSENHSNSYGKGLFAASLMIFFFGLIIAVVNEVTSKNSLISNLSIAFATAFGPIAIISVFLRTGFDEIFYAAAVKSIDNAIKDERRNLDLFRIELKNQLTLCQRHSQELIDNTATLAVLRNCGVVDAYEKRSAAYEKIKSWLKDRNNTEFIFVGTSFRGLYWPHEGDEKIFDLIKERINENRKLLDDPYSSYMRFIFTHPAFAYLREKSEGNERPDGGYFKIRTEILQSVIMLRKIGVPENCIKFFKGTPTIFGVMTNNLMFLNPYPYKKQSYTSFGFVVQNVIEPTVQFSLYKTYRMAHFEGVWMDSENTETWHDDKLEHFWKSTISSVVTERLDENVPQDLKLALGEILAMKNITVSRTSQ